MGAGGALCRRGGSSLRGLSGYALFWVAMLYALLVFLLTAWFAAIHPLPLRPAMLMALSALPLGALFGVVINLFDRVLGPAATVLRRRSNPSATSLFLLFFVYIIGYILLFTSVVAWPLSLLAGDTLSQPSPAVKFRLFTINFVLLLALFSWVGAKRRLGEKVARVLKPWWEKIR